MPKVIDSLLNIYFGSIYAYSESITIEKRDDKMGYYEIKK